MKEELPFDVWKQMPSDKLPWRGGGGGGGGSHIKGWSRLLVGNFEKTPKRYQDSLLCVWLEMFFNPKRYRFPKGPTSTLILFLRGFPQG